MSELWWVGRSEAGDGGGDGDKEECVGMWVWVVASPPCHLRLRGILAGGGRREEEEGEGVIISGCRVHGYLRLSQVKRGWRW